MKTKYKPKMKSLIGTLLFLLLLGYQAGAQALSGTYSIPGSYSTIEAAVAALNNNGISSAVVFNIGAGTAYTESPSSTIVLGSTTLNASTSSTNTITFQRQQQQLPIH